MSSCGLFEVVGIYDIDPAVKKKADARHIAFFKSVDELFAYPGLQAVLIATPNDVHKEYAIAAANHGLAVLCEKPVTLCCADLQEMLDAAKKNGTLFSVHQNRRWDHDYLCMKKIVEQIAVPGLQPLRTPSSQSTAWYLPVSTASFNSLSHRYDQHPLVSEKTSS